LLIGLEMYGEQTVGMGKLHVGSQLQLSQCNSAWETDTVGYTMITKKTEGKNEKVLPYLLGMPMDLA